MWGGVAYSFYTSVKWLSEPKNYCQDCLMSSAQSFYGPCLKLVVHSLTCSFSGNMPLLHMSTQHPGTSLSLYEISFSRPSPALILQVTNAGVRRPGYEARVWQYHCCCLFTQVQCRKYACKCPVVIRNHQCTCKSHAPVLSCVFIVPIRHLIMVSVFTKQEIFAALCSTMATTHTCWY